MMMTSTPNKRSLWPCAIGGYFFIAFVGAAIFVTWAVRQDMDLVRPDYYEHEILYQKQIDAVNRTRPFRAEVGVSYEFNERRLAVRVPSAHVMAQFSGTAHLYRPADAKLDRRVDLKPASNGTQTIDTTQLAPGPWKVRLDWTANGEAFAFEQNIIIGG